MGAIEAATAAARVMCAPQKCATRAHRPMYCLSADDQSSLRAAVVARYRLDTIEAGFPCRDCLFPHNRPPRLSLRAWQRVDPEVASSVYVAGFANTRLLVGCEPPDIHSHSLPSPYTCILCSVTPREQRPLILSVAVVRHIPVCSPIGAPVELVRIGRPVWSFSQTAKAESLPCAGGAGEKGSKFMSSHDMYIVTSAPPHFCLQGGRLINPLACHFSGALSWQDDRV